MITRFLGTALTGIGGHYLNRRWDKAAMFLCIFFTYFALCTLATGSFVYHSYSGGAIQPDLLFETMKSAAKYGAIAYLAGIVLLWMVSIVVSIKDRRLLYKVSIKKWTRTGIIAALLTTLFSMTLLAGTISAAVFFINPKMPQIVPPTQQPVQLPPSDNFIQSLDFGVAPHTSDRLPAPPAGNGQLKGRVTYEDLPVTGLSLSLVLNSRYRTGNVVTDADGFFAVPLPAGNWEINSVQARHWPGKPDDRSYLLYHGGEPRLAGNAYYRYANFTPQGHGVEVKEKADTLHLDLSIKKGIALQWPAINPEGANASISDAIRWAPVSGATQYQVNLLRVSREGSTIDFNPVASRLISGETRLELSGLKHIQSPKTPPVEYAVKIFAFAEKGELLGEFSNPLDGGTFILADGHTLLEGDLQDPAGANSDAGAKQIDGVMDAIKRDRGRIRAVEVLIADKMLPVAQSLLNRVNSDYVQGEKEVLAGYIMALKGECAKSRALFDQARSINPRTRIPKEYRNVCNQQN